MPDKISDDQREMILEFAQESRELIEQLEPSIIELGQKKDEQVLNSIFRLFHSIKGGAGFMGFNNIARVTHVAENLLDQVRTGKIHLQCPKHVYLLCDTCDFLKEALDYLEKHLSDNDLGDQANAIASKLEEEIKEDAHTPQPAKPGLETAEPNLELKITKEMLERFVQEADDVLQNIEQGLLTWLKSLKDLEIIDGLFRNIHSFKGNCGFYGFADLERLSHKMETVLEAARAGVEFGKSDPAKMLLQLEDVLHGAIEDIAQGGDGNISGLNIYLDLLNGMLPKDWQSTEDDLAPVRLGNILIDEGNLAPADVDAALETQRKPLGEILIEKGITTAADVDKALKSQKKSLGEILVEKGVTTSKHIKKALKKQEKARAEIIEDTSKKTIQPLIKRQDIRVDLGKLDHLLNIIGEMVITQNMLINNPEIEDLELESFNKAAQQMDKIIRELQEVAMTIRMIPVSGLFRRMVRLVHDLSGKFNKKVDLRVFGEDTELDKTVVETITDPLIHIVRNSLDHGLESIEERLKAGKSESGTVKLTAVHEEGEVWIIVEDDGRGLNREKILASAIKKGFIKDDGLEMTDEEVFDLIFLPGFSTAENVSDVSGRGVGMDVVKRNIERINGKIEVQSKLGEGTKIILCIPLTMAIIDGMMVSVGDSMYILPILSIRESFCPNPKAITVSPDGQELVRVREEFFPVVRLHELYKITPQHQELQNGILIVLETHKTRFCLFVDEILGQEQTVIKGLSNYIGNIRGVSGCTILGNGDVCMILDVGSLFKLAGVTGT